MLTGAALQAVQLRHKLLAAAQLRKQGKALNAGRAPLRTQVSG